jgi:hypothetical protein
MSKYPLASKWQIPVSDTNKQTKFHLKLIYFYAFLGRKATFFVKNSLILLSYGCDFNG